MSAAGNAASLAPYNKLTYTILPREYGDANRQIIEDHYNAKLRTWDEKIRENPKVRKSFRNLDQEKKEKSLADFNTSRAITRNIVVQTIPQGTLLYHYLERKPILYSSSGNRPYTAKEHMIYYYSRFAFQAISYNHKNDSVEFKLSKSLVNPKYYFGVPYVAYGVDMPSTTYNTMIPVVVKEDMHIAYLKSGSEVPNESIMHRLYPTDVFNFQRVTACQKIQKNTEFQCEGGVCGSGSDVDACLRKQFAAEHSIGGIAAIAGHDSMFQVNTTTGKNYPQKLQTKLIEYKDRSCRNEMHHVIYSWNTIGITSSSISNFYYFIW
jgi:hypothetical protein